MSRSPRRVDAHRLYAPLKHPGHPVPSGDRLIARLLILALAHAGHRVEVMSRLRTRDGTGDPARQSRIEQTAARVAERLLARLRERPAEDRPALWFTYHLYHKAPDLLGPPLSRALGIPYVVAEASHAPKQAHGPWRRGYALCEAALRQADAIVSLSSFDVPGLLKLLGDAAPVVRLPPFLQLDPDIAAAPRAALARRHDLDPNRPWLLTVAMMRPGNKLDSYRLLARALGQCMDREWQLVVAGDGPARPEVEVALAGLGADRVRDLGRLEGPALAELRAGADLFVWPAVSEPLGMALLEAQAAGLAVVAGRSRGVADIVRDGITGRLVEPGDVTAFAAAVRSLLDDSGERARLGRAGRSASLANHNLPAAARRLDAVVRGLVSS